MVSFKRTVNNLLDQFDSNGFNWLSFKIEKEEMKILFTEVINNIKDPSKLTENQIKILQSVILDKKLDEEIANLIILETNALFPGDNPLQGKADELMAEFNPILETYASTGEIIINDMNLFDLVGIELENLNNIKSLLSSASILNTLFLPFYDTIFNKIRYIFNDANILLGRTTTYISLISAVTIFLKKQNPVGVNFFMQFISLTITGIAGIIVSQIDLGSYIDLGTYTTFLSGYTIPFNVINFILNQALPLTIFSLGSKFVFNEILRTIIYFSYSSLTFINVYNLLTTYKKFNNSLTNINNTLNIIDTNVFVLIDKIIISYFIWRFILTLVTTFSPYSNFFVKTITFLATPTIIYFIPGLNIN